MTLLGAKAQVAVSIVSALSHAAPSSWQIDYQVRNDSRATVWLVDDASLALRLDGHHAELCFARVPMQPGVQVIGDFAPRTSRIEVGTTVNRTVRVSWPCPLSDIWNPARESAPAPGWYQLSVRIGFATSPAPLPSAGTDVESAVLAWQQQAVSTPVPIALAPYAPTQ